MSATAAPRPRGILSRLSDRFGREGLCWVISLLFHACLIVLLVSVWIIVVRPKDRVSVGPVVGGWHHRAQRLRASAPKGDDRRLSLAGSSAWPAVAQVFKPDRTEAFGRSGLASRGRTDAQIALPGRGPCEQLKLPGWGRGAGLTEIGEARHRPGGGPIRVVYVLDASGSMIDHLDAVKKRLLVDLSRLAFDERTGRGDSFNVIFFRSRPEAFWSRMLLARDRNKVAAARWIRQIRAWGQTQPLAALRLAFQSRPDCIVVLSDGQFGQEVLSGVDALQRSAAAPVKIITIGYGKTFSGKNLEILAARNGGVFIRLSDE